MRLAREERGVSNPPRRSLVMKAIACALLLTALFTGCARMRGSDVSASPDTTNPQSDKVSCDMSGGKWNQNTRMCDR
jgi:hypothetical protein